METEDKTLSAERQQTFPECSLQFLREYNFRFLLLFPSKWTLPHL